MSMAKTRIYDLARELNVSNKEILDFVGGDRVASSSVEDDVASSIRKRFGKGNSSEADTEAAKASKPEEKPAPQAAPADKKEEEKPVKKSNISAVFNPQNSKMKGHPEGERRPRPEGERRPRPDGERRPRPEGERRPRPEGEHRPRPEGERRPRPEGERRLRPEGERGARPEGERRLKTEGERRPRPEGERRSRPEGERGARPEGERRLKTDGERRPRPEGERRPRPEGERRPHPEGEHGARPDGERRPRPEGEHGTRPDGERRPRPEGERGARPDGERRLKTEGERGARPDGERRPRTEGERGPRPEGERKPRYEGEGQRSRGDGDRRDGRQGGDRQGRQRGESQGRQGGDRSRRNSSDRPRQDGERNGRSEKGDRDNRKNTQNSGNFADRNQGGRGGRQDGAGRSKEQRGASGRVGGRDAGKNAPSDTRGKESRSNAGGKKDNRKKKQDYDKKNKKQENFVNLEKKTGHRKHNAAPSAPGSKDTGEVKTIILPEYLTVRELADAMKVNPSEIIKKLFLAGEMLTVNQEINYDKAEEIAVEFNCIAEPEEKVDVIAELLREDEEDEKTMVTRPPVVCVMGHVDHGKTSLLDAIRDTKVTDKEAGGITQAIGASVVEINGQKITFLDTPGHEAFTAMRMRGANSTDIAVLVVAADDGIMPQTIEAIHHAKAAGVEVIVAINKIDKEGANVERVKQSLTEYELTPEDWGGSTICVPVSAKTGEGITDLLEMILLSAEVLELKANPNRNARGLVIEAKLDKGRGPVATVLVQKGTLKVGQNVAVGSCYGRVRAMIDDNGRRVKEAGPSMPVEVLGLSGVPGAGEVFVVCDSEKEAKDFAATFVSQDKERLLEETRARMSLDDIFSRIQEGNLKELDLIVKADVQGSVEALKQSLLKLSNDEVVVKVIHGGVGNINESDVSLAAASNAVIIGFNVKPDNVAKSVAETENVDIHLYSVIYKAIEDVENAMKGMLDPIYEERVIGHAEIRQIFKASGVGNIAGSYVTDGVIERGCKVRISRDGKQIFEGNLGSLKRFKDDVKEVKSGYECGLVFEGFNDIQEMDIVEAYKMVEVPR